MVENLAHDREESSESKDVLTVFLSGTYKFHYPRGSYCLDSSFIKLSEMVPYEYAGRFRHGNPIDSATLFRSIAPPHPGASRHPS